MQPPSPEDMIKTIQYQLAIVGSDEQEQSEIEQIADFRNWYEDCKYEITEDVMELDREMIRKAGELGKYIHDEGHYDNEMKSLWMWNPDLIAKGNFPLQELPAHVRELAGTLYYGDNEESQHK